MQNLAKKRDTSTATELAGYVIRIEGPAAWVRTDDGEIRARRAVSCLVDPVLGDRVLCALLADGTAYVLAVLEREDDAAATMSMDRDLAIKIPSGRFEVVTQEGVGFVTPGDVSIVSGELDINAAEGRVSFDRLSAMGRQWLAEVSAVKVVAGALDSVLDRLSQKVKRSYKTVEELDQVRAKRIDYAAEKSLHMSAENALVTASELVKFDGENIHLG